MQPRLGLSLLLALGSLALVACDSDGGGGDDGDLAYCVSLINEYRAAHGKSALERADALEDCAADGAREDAASGRPHGHFSDTGGCGGVTDAENEIPGWPQGEGGVREVIENGTAMMMDEGPGGGHYENILGEHEAVGCGIHVTADGSVWVVQDFK